ncbi:MAG: hypothetical protein H6555_01750 [Lewinellaceae bacterium]|nr:hypothetical protein [Lewinellaceae bacterium]
MRPAWFITLGGILLLSVVVIACREERLQPDIDYGYDYFPLKLGAERIYLLDSLVFDPAPGGTRIDSTRLWVREVWADTLRGPAGELRYRVDRYERYREEDPWQIRAVYTEQREALRAFRTEDNRQRIALIFPLQADSRWNATGFFDPLQPVTIAGEPIEMYKGWSSEVTQWDEPWQAGDLAFPRTAVIQLADFTSLIEIRQCQERYARGVGLVYREFTILDTQCQVCCQGNFSRCSSLPWREKAEKGMIIRQTLFAYR